MKATCTAPLALLACAGLLGCGEVVAQARGAPVATRENVAQDPALERITALTKLDAWLRRLPGRFRITAYNQTLGEADCVGIGAGSGVHCIYRFAQPGMKDEWRAEVRMFGMDLDAPGVGFLRLRSDSLAEGGVAKLRDDAIFFIGDCPVVQPERTGPTLVTVLGCQQELRVYAPPGKAIRIRNRVRQFVMVSPPPSPMGGISRPRRTQTSYTVEWVLEPVP